MTLPAGIQTKTLSIGRPFDALGDIGVLKIEVTPVFGGTAQRLVWSATGDTFEAFTVIPPAETSPDGDPTETIELPIVDQAGWLDGSGNTITGWSYQVSVTPGFVVNGLTKRMKTYTKFVSPLSTDTSTIDMDRLPDGTAASPTLAPGPSLTTDTLAWRKLDAWTGTAETTDDSAALAAAFAAALTGGFGLVATDGKTYRGKNLDPTGTVVNWTGATLMHPAGGAAANVLVPTGAYRTIGGTFDGNKANTTDPGSDLLANGVYCYNAAGWSGEVRMEGAPVFRNCWSYDARFLTITALNGAALSDADNALPAAVFLEHPEATGAERSGINCYGLDGLVVDHPYAHGNTANGISVALCKGSRVTGVRAHLNGQHGYVSQYCVDDYADGAAHHNGKGGFTWGGGSTAIVPGRRHKFGDLATDYNGQSTSFGGVTFDPTVSGDATSKVVDAKGVSITARFNTLAGFQVTLADTIDVDAITCDNNGTGGIALSGKRVSYRVARCRNNGTTSSHHGIAEFGSTTQYGGHMHGRFELSGNGDGRSTPYVANPGSIVPSTYTMVQSGSPNPATIPTSAVVIFDVKQGADQSISSGTSATPTTPVNSNLVLALPVGEYVFEAYLRMDGSTTGDLRNTFTFPAGSWSWSAYGPTTTATGTPATVTASGVNTAAEVALNGAVGVGTPVAVRVQGVLTVTTAGNLQHKFAQSTSDPTATTLYAASRLWARWIG